MKKVCWILGMSLLLFGCGQSPNPAEPGESTPPIVDECDEIKDEQVLIADITGRQWLLSDFDMMRDHTLPDITAEDIANGVGIPVFATTSELLEWYHALEIDFETRLTFMELNGNIIDETNLAGADSRELLHTTPILLTPDRPEAQFWVEENPETPTADNDVHIVQPGETLYDIAASHGLDYWELAVWNQIPLTDIVENQVTIGFRAEVYPGQAIVLTNPISYRQPIQIELETDKQSDSSMDVMVFDLGGDWTSPNLLFTSEQTLENVRLVTVSMEAAGVFTAHDLLYSFGNLGSSNGIEIQNYHGLGSLPWKGFVFFDSEGTERMFIFGQSQMDSSFNIWEVVHFVWE
jgi:hypothetical protein